MQTGGGGVAAQNHCLLLTGGFGALLERSAWALAEGRPPRVPPRPFVPEHGQAATQILSKLASELCWVTGDVLAGRMLKENPSCFGGLQAKFSISRSGVRRPARRQQIQDS